MDKEKLFFARSRGRVFACVADPFLIAELSESKGGCEPFSAAYGELRIEIYPPDAYEDMSSEERFALEEKIIGGYDSWADQRKPHMRKVSKFGRLAEVPEWLKAENCASGQICLFNARKGAVLLVEERDGEPRFDGKGVTSALMLEAERFLRENV